jgi:hypothetical protein
MAFEEITLLQEPVESSPEDAGRYLAEFIHWLHTLVDEIGIQVIQTGNVRGSGSALLFDSALIQGLPRALQEIKRNRQFEQLEKLLTEPPAETIKMIRQHGLYGAQLKWKLANINCNSRDFI